MASMLLKNQTLWQVKHFSLITSVRQTGNKTYETLLTRARVGLLNDNDTALFQSRLVQKLSLNSSTVLHGFPKLGTSVHDVLMENTLPNYRHTTASHDTIPHLMILMHSKMFQMIPFLWMIEMQVACLLD